MLGPFRLSIEAFDVKLLSSWVVYCRIPDPSSKLAEENIIERYCEIYQKGIYSKGIDENNLSIRERA
jgi:hypothetical protein